MYAVHPIPLSEVKAVRKHVPSFGWQYIVLVLVNGLTLPPLYFGTGGVKALFSALKQVWISYVASTNATLSEIGGLGIHCLTLPAAQQYCPPMLAARMCPSVPGCGVHLPYCT